MSISHQNYNEAIPKDIKDPEKFLRHRRRLLNLQYKTENSRPFKIIRSINYTVTACVAIYCFGFADWGSENNALTPIRETIKSKLYSLVALDERDKLEMKYREAKSENRH